MSKTPDASKETPPALQEASAGLFASAGLLEDCRTKWQYGDWAALTALDIAAVAEDPDREKIACLIAAAHGQCDAQDQARRFARQALDWGCSRGILARVLVSSVQNSLARVATSLELPEAARAHFEEAISLVEPRADVALLARTRQIRETARAGLLPQAAQALEEELQIIRETPEDHAPRLRILASDIEQLRHELSIALQRGQIFDLGAGQEGGQPLERGALEQRAKSQLGQDLWVLERSQYKRGGFFIEFGATDGLALSNSWLLEKDFGWSGICAEPNPAFFAELQKNRSCQLTPACIGGISGEEVEFVLADVFGGISAYGEEDMHSDKREAYRAEGQTLRLTTVSLDEVLTQQNAPREIDYLSIDTEGSEYEILRHFPFDKWKIRLITVEHNFTPQRQQIFDLLTSNGYRRAAEKDFDDWYELISQQEPVQETAPDSTAAQVVVVAGVPRSGSTWLFNAVRLLYALGGRKAYTAWCADYRPADHADYEVHVVKLHDLEQMTFEHDLVLTTQRDVAEQLASLLRMGWLDEDAEQIREAAEGHRKLARQWQNRSDCGIRYEDIMARPEAAILQLAAVLGVACTVQQAQEIASQLAILPSPTSGSYDPETLLHPEHRGSEAAREDALAVVLQALQGHEGKE